MFQIDLKNRKPIYEQVVGKFTRLILAGTLAEGSRVPSVRELAREIGVNPNTVQKAYRELESRGYIYTVMGQGSFISSLSDTDAGREIEGLYGQLRQNALELMFRGESKDKIVVYVRTLEIDGERSEPPQRREEA